VSGGYWQTSQGRRSIKKWRREARLTRIANEHGLSVGWLKSHPGWVSPQPPLPSGPAFIPLPHPLSSGWISENVPPGYIWKNATDWTGAGWVRPHGGN
jgi:hypothetical protein